VQNVDTGPHAAVQVRLEGPTFKLLEDWRRRQEKIPARPTAIRQLVLKALAAEQSNGKS